MNSKPKRPNLGLAAVGGAEATIPGLEAPSPPPVAAAPPPLPLKLAKVPPVSVYLEEHEIRRLKLWAMDRRDKMTNICATAIREYMAKHGM